jgi:ABC-2 type transport system ATP-binding protein
VTGTSIETRELTKKFGAYRAVDRITFTVSKGEIFGFLGANGAGKTTAIRMLCGLLLPSGGEGRVAGFDIMREPMRIRRRIGYMPQKFSLYRDLTVRQNMELYGSIYGLDRRRLRARIEAMTSLLSMGDLLDRPTGALPQGWRQRCALACADLHEPEILFLDEPTGSVDPVSRKTFWDLIIDLAAGGKTVLVTTHHLDEAEYCHRISIMVDGRIAKIDTPRNLREQTRTASLHEAFLAIVEEGRKEAESV